jgi:hypothetical protein
LNSTIHIIAVTQIRMPNSIGRAYYDKKIAAGKSRNEAMRCLKRRLANHIWRLMIADERHQQAARHPAPKAGNSYCLDQATRLFVLVRRVAPAGAATRCHLHGQLPRAQDLNLRAGHFVGRGEQWECQLFSQQEC